MKLQTAINQATKHLLKSDKARTYKAITWDSKKYILELEKDKEFKVLNVVTWGFEYETIRIPRNRQELIQLKCIAQVATHNDYVAQVAKRYYLDILRRESR